MTAEREGLAEIAGVLAEHRIVRDDFSPHCSCGLFRDKRDHDQANYRAHLAAALADLLAARDRRVRAEALREAAVDPGLRLSGHSGISITRLRDRADRIEAEG